MSASAPKRTRTPEEKLEHAAAHRKTPKEFNDLITSHVSVAKAIFTLGKLLDKGGNGSVLQLEDGKDIQTFSRKDLRDAEREFLTSLADLKTVFRISRKTVKTKPQPEDFKGVYGPVYMAPALQKFFNPTDPYLFGRVDPTDENSPPLISQLPYAQGGFIQRNTCATLFHIYASVNQLHDAENGQKIKLEEHFRDCFGSADPDLYCPYFKVAGQKEKMAVEAAIAAGFIERPMNTFDSIRLGGFEEKIGSGVKQTTKAFDPVGNGYYLMTSFSNISSLNYHNLNLLQLMKNEDILARMADGEYQKGMVTETYLVNGTKEIWKALKAPGQKQKKTEKKREADQAKKAAKAAK